MRINAKLIQVKSKIYSKVLFFLVIILLIEGALNMVKLVYAGIQSGNNFSVSENMDKFENFYYYLNISDKDFYGIELDKILTRLETDLPNYKVTYMVGICIELISQLLLITILAFVYKMLQEMVEAGRAFNISNINRLKIISNLILLIVFIPSMLELAVNFHVFLQASMRVSLNDLLLVFISFTVWGISYVMAYGCELQKEVDEIL